MNEVRVPRRRRPVLALGAVLAGSLAASLALAQGPYNERDVRREMNIEDKSEDVLAKESKIWVLDFRFKDPRLITVDIPGRGRKICLYLWYQVINNTKEPRTFIPDFELVTLDKPGVHHDQVLPKVQEAVRQIEDPTGYLNIKNSVTIAAEPIPPSKPDAVPKAVTGVAIWDDVNPDANRYSIFVSGLSNGWSLAEIPPDNKQVVRRKTLQLNFKRLGDRYYQHSGEIRFVPPTEWIYRASTLVPPSGVLPKEAPKKKEATEKQPGAAVPPPAPTPQRSSAQR
jgi:hypothetical protein